MVSNLWLTFLCLDWMRDCENVRAIYIFMVRFSPWIGILFISLRFESNMGFESTIYIQVQTWSQVTEVYSSRLGLKTRVLPTFITGYILFPNARKGGPFQRIFTGTLKHWSQRRHLGVIWPTERTLYTYFF